MLAKKIVRIPYPRPQNLAYPARVLFDEGPLSRSDPFSGQSESWPDRGPGTVDRLVAKVERREALRPTSLGARGWRYQLREAKRLLRLRGVPLAHPGASRRSTPSRGSRGILQTSDALRRENTEVWLFESVDHEFEARHL